MRTGSGCGRRRGLGEERDALAPREAERESRREGGRRRRRVAGTVCELAPEPARHASRMRGGATAPPPPRSGETGPALHMYGPLLFGPSIFLDKSRWE